jgi:hypothetical protein
MKTIAILHVIEGAQPSRVQALLPDEVRMAWDGMKSGIVRAAHYIAHGGGGVLELETAEAAQAEAFVRALPLVAAGLVRCTTYPLVPYTGFDLLMNQDRSGARAERGDRAT